MSEPHIRYKAGTVVGEEQEKRKTDEDGVLMN